MLTDAKGRKIIMVRATTNVAKLANSIFATHNTDKEQIIVCRSVGASALNQSTKGIIVANKQFIPKGLLITTLPEFNYMPSTKEDGSNISVIDLTLKIIKTV